MKLKLTRHNFWAETAYLFHSHPILMPGPTQLSKSKSTRFSHLVIANKMDLNRHKYNLFNLKSSRSRSRRPWCLIPKHNLCALRLNINKIWRSSLAAVQTNIMMPNWYYPYDTPITIQLLFCGSRYQCLQWRHSRNGITWTRWVLVDQEVGSLTE